MTLPLLTFYPLYHYICCVPISGNYYTVMNCYQPHVCTAYMWHITTHRVAWSGIVSVTQCLLLRLCPCKIGWTDRDALWDVNSYHTANLLSICAIAHLDTIAPCSLDDRPENKGLDQLWSNSTHPIGDCWRRAVEHGHGGAMTQQPLPATWQWWWWFRLVGPKNQVLDESPHAPWKGRFWVEHPGTCPVVDNIHTQCLARWQWQYGLLVTVTAATCWCYYYVDVVLLDRCHGCS